MPSRRIQDILSINDGGGCGREFAGNGKGVAGGVFYLHSRPVVIPAKAGIQEGDDGVVNGFQNSSACAVKDEVRLLFPLTRVDSSFRWNDGGGCSRESAGNGKGVAGVVFYLHSRPVVILAKAGIQEGDDGVVNGFQDSPAYAVENEVRLLFPLTRVDSSFRWNDGGGCGRKSAGYDRRVVGVSSIFISAPLSFQRKLESRKSMTEWSMDSRIRLPTQWKMK